MQQTNTTSTGKTRAVRRHLLSSSDGAGLIPTVTDALPAGHQVAAPTTPVATAVAAPAVVQGSWLQADEKAKTPDGEPTFIKAKPKSLTWMLY